MELQTSTMVAIFVACMLLTQSLAIPISSNEEGTSLSAEKRPKYMETRRRDLSFFKDILLFALDELIDEGKVNPNVLVDSEDMMIDNKDTMLGMKGTMTGNKDTVIDNNTDKRGRHLGICLRISPSGSYIPRPCWRREGRLRR